MRKAAGRMPRTKLTLIVNMRFKKAAEPSVPKPFIFLILSLSRLIKIDVTTIIVSIKTPENKGDRKKGQRILGCNSLR